MATTLYLRATTADEPKPNVKQSATSITQYVSSTLGGGQDSGTTIYPLDMKTAAGADATRTISQSITETGATHYAWFKAWVSPKLDIDQTITGTLTVTFDHNEGNLAHNMMPRIRVYVWKGDDTGVRGVLYADANSATESDATDATLQTFFSAVALTSVAALANDRIVIECMSFNNNTKTVAYVHALNFDGAVAGNRESYIQFSQNITFVSAGTPQFQTVSDIAGLLDSVTQKQAGKTTVTDLAGLLDSVSVALKFPITVTDLTGLLDSTSLIYAGKSTVSDLTGLLDSVIINHNVAVGAGVSAGGGVSAEAEDSMVESLHTRIIRHHKRSNLPYEVRALLKHYLETKLKEE